MTTRNHETHDERAGVVGGARAATSARDRIAEALQDVLTTKVLDTLTGGFVKPATLEGLADYVDAPTADVEERLKRLVDWNLVEAMTEPGPAGQVYRSTRDALITDEIWETLTGEQRRMQMTLTLDTLIEHIWNTVDRGGFDAPSTHASWLPVDLDREGHEAMVRLTIETLERARDIQAEVADRRANGTSDGGSVKSDLMLLHFDRGLDLEQLSPTELEALREDLFRLLDELADEAPEAWPNWRGLTLRGRELAQVATRLGAAARRTD